MPRKSDWTICCNCPGQILYTAWDTSNPRSARQRSMGWSAGVDGNIWPSIWQNVSRGSGLGSCLCFLLLNSLRPQERIEGFLYVQDGWARGPQRTRL